MEKISVYILIVTLVLSISCSEDDLNPSLKQDKVYDGKLKNLEELQGVALGMYNRITTPAYYGRNCIIYGEVRADNCFVNGNSGRFVTVGKMSVSPDGNYAMNTWSEIYKVIASANMLIQQDIASIEGNPDLIRHIIGQAYVVRAMAHFDLLKLFGQQHAGGNLGIPYVTDYIPAYTGEQIAPPREEVASNRESVMADINAGLSLLSDDFNGNSREFITTYAAHALKARVALYFSDWETAKTAALAVINSGNFRIAAADEYAQTWHTDEAVNSVFELAFSADDNNDFNSLSFIYRGSTYGDIEVLEDLVSVFDEGDIRVVPEMIGYETVKGQPRLRNLGKYPSADYSDNVPVFRIEEMYLILAEAKMELGESDALEVLNQVPAHRNAKLFSEATKENLLLERRRELCFEGFRFDDLARTGRDIPLVDTLKQTHGGAEYGSYNFAFPIPTVELNANPNMVKNEGY